MMRQTLDFSHSIVIYAFVIACAVCAVVAHSDCPALPGPAGGTAGSCDETTPIGATCSFSCFAAAGYVLAGLPRVCNSSGQFSPPAQYCQFLVVQYAYWRITEGQFAWLSPNVTGLPPTALHWRNPRNDLPSGIFLNASSGTFGAANETSDTTSIIVVTIRAHPEASVSTHVRVKVLSSGGSFSWDTLGYIFAGLVLPWTSRKWIAYLRKSEQSTCDIVTAIARRAGGYGYHLVMFLLVIPLHLQTAVLYVYYHCFVLFCMVMYGVLAPFGASIYGNTLALCVLCPRSEDGYFEPLWVLVDWIQSCIWCCPSLVWTLLAIPTAAVCASSLIPLFLVGDPVMAVWTLFGFQALLAAGLVRCLLAPDLWQPEMLSKFLRTGKGRQTILRVRSLRFRRSLRSAEAAEQHAKSRRCNCNCLRRLHVDNVLASIAVLAEFWQLSAVTFSTPFVPWFSFSTSHPIFHQIVSAAVLYLPSFRLAFIIDILLCSGFVIAMQASNTASMLGEVILAGGMSAAEQSAASRFSSSAAVAGRYLLDTVFLLAISPFLRVFACETDASGTFSMRADPTVDCESSFYLAFALPAMYVLLCMVPLALLYISNVVDIGRPEPRPSAQTYDPVFTVCQMWLKFTFEFLITIVVPLSSGPLRLLALLLLCLSISGYLLLQHPCYALSFNFIRGGFVLAAGWTNVASIVAWKVDDSTNWTPTIVLVVGWLIIAVVAWLLAKRARLQVLYADSDSGSIQSSSEGTVITNSDLASVQTVDSDVSSINQDVQPEAEAAEDIDVRQSEFDPRQFSQTDADYLVMSNYSYE